MHGSVRAKWSSITDFDQLFAQKVTKIVKLSKVAFSFLHINEAIIFQISLALVQWNNWFEALHRKTKGFWYFQGDIKWKLAKMV